MEKISVAIITLNEEKNIKRCLDSVKDLADEIVVVDSFSSDRTQEICEEEGVRFIQHKWLGYVETKNFVAGQCKHDLILSLDADEALSETLKETIHKIKSQRTSDGYTFNRMTNYCGKWMKHGGWYPDKKLRLYDRQKGRWSGVDIHEYVQLDQNSTVSHLRGDLLHYSFYTIEDHVRQAAKFSKIAAMSLVKRGKTPTMMKVIFSGPLRFLRDYFFKAGFLDGYYGLVRCCITAHATFLKNAYHLEAYRNHKSFE